MSDWNGKGSKSRVTDIKAYWDSPLWKKKESNVNYNHERCLFLDDVRMPKEAILWDSKQHLLDVCRIPQGSWTIVRSYEEFVDYIDNIGIPDVVSFDNDLWDVSRELAVSPTNEELAKQFQMIGWQDFKIKTGAHCAEYLVKACKARNVAIPKYYIHTANSAARPIIKEILENAKL
jgi:hypothetical protein